MLVPKCYTCGKVLSHVEIRWIQKKEECENNPNLSKEETLTIMAAYLDELGIKSRCCRKCLLTFVEHVKIIM